MSKIKVLVIDHSAVMRKFLSDVLMSAVDIDVAATAINLAFARNKIRQFAPDVITLDVNIPGEDYQEFLHDLLTENPVPVVVISSHASIETTRAAGIMGSGAVDFVLKPSYEEIVTKEALISFSNELHVKIRAVAQSRDAIRLRPVPVPRPGTMQQGGQPSTRIVAIGASTGGVEALFSILTRLSEKLPGICVVQHMPVEFTGPFADRVNKFSRIRVTEAKDGDRIFDGTAFIAPGNRHMRIGRDMKGYFVILDDSEPVGVGRFKPAVDVLFQSAADVAGSNAMGVILTGMGADGAKGLLAMKESGAVTIAQDRKSSAVFGMPMKAIEMGAATMVKSLDGIVQYLQGLSS